MATDDLSALKPVYIIYGEQDILLDQAVDRLKRLISATGDLDFNFETFEGGASLVDDVIAAANTLPFLSEKRLVVLNGLDGVDAAAQSMLAVYAQDPSPSTVLVMTCKKVDRRTKLFKAVHKTGVVAEYKAERSEYPGLIVEMFRKRGCEVTRDGAATLMDRVGMDLRRLSVEADKISAFVGPERRLGRDEIEAVVAKTAPVSIFTFTDAIGLRELETALRAASALQDDGESAVRLATMSTWHLRNLVKVKALAERGLDRSALTRQAGLRGEWQTRNLLRQAERFETAELIAGLRGAAQMEAEMKTSPVEPGLVLERWIATVCRATPWR